MNVAQAQTLKEFTDGLEDLNDNEVLDVWHQASEEHKAASAGDKDFRLAMRLSAEGEAILRFGVGEHEKRLNERHPG